MASIKVILVEPLYQINLGYIARVSKNFGVKRLCMVRPRCNHKGAQAIKYAKHARELLLGAKICDSIAKETAGSLVIGTTAVWKKAGGAFHNVYTLDKALEMMGRHRGRISLLIGRDDTGLTKEELSMCDATVFIPTEEAYPALNISHALAILLYSLTKTRMPREAGFQRMYASSEDIRMLERLFAMLISHRHDIRDKRAVAMAFSHLIARASPTKKELRALSIALSPGHAGNAARERV